MKTRIGKLGFMLLAAGFIVSLANETALAKYPKTEIFVIGDSLSDPGNLYVLTHGLLPPSPPYSESYSNDMAWTEYLSAEKGLRVDSRAHGGALSGVFALGGVFGNVSNFNTVQYSPYFPGLPGVSEEIDGLLEDYPGGLNPRAIYVVWSGANDFFLGLTLAVILDDPTKLTDTLQQTVANTAEAVCRLGAAGARHFAVGNIPDIGLTPFVKDMGTPAQAQFSYIIGLINDGLAQALNSLPAECADTLVILDSYEILHAVTEDPDFFGLENVTEACLVDSIPCSNPDAYLFWDSVHPTTAGQKIFAEEFQAELRGAFCGSGELPPGLKLRGKPMAAPPDDWRGLCYGAE